MVAWSSLVARGEVSRVGDEIVSVIFGLVYFDFERWIVLIVTWDEKVDQDCMALELTSRHRRTRNGLAEGMVCASRQTQNWVPH